MRKFNMLKCISRIVLIIQKFMLNCKQCMYMGNLFKIRIKQLNFCLGRSTKKYNIALCIDQWTL
ncbi:unnamed protein product [Paramecium sonneborni]|uniref:Uncharacterized protein n=1 Tax=Paramecium sonneborni TaxID=65129 RepID=A0A8S1K138_9CILI|nr:unnamed protein product [Paramecium sonneborni]